MASDSVWKAVKYTAEDKLTAIQRELWQRRNVYPRMVERGTMKVDFMERQLAVFEAIEADYAEQVKAERLL
jgi:hypothetical protein